MRKYWIIDTVRASSGMTDLSGRAHEARCADREKDTGWIQTHRHRSHGNGQQPANKIVSWMLASPKNIYNLSSLRELSLLRSSSGGGEATFTGNPRHGKWTSTKAKAYVNVPIRGGCSWCRSHGHGCFLRVVPLVYSLVLASYCLLDKINGLASLTKEGRDD